MARPPKPLEERYWQYVEKTEYCWLWRGLRARRYGSIRGHGPDYVKRPAHRVAWELAYGSIPGGLFVLHRCDNPVCVNPAHLFLGTHQDNMRDRQMKQRHAYGERSPMAKLTLEQIQDIRRRHAAGETQTALAREYGVRQGHVSRIIRRASWRHVAPERS